MWRLFYLLIVKRFVHALNRATIDRTAYLVLQLYLSKARRFFFCTVYRSHAIGNNTHGLIRYQCGYVFPFLINRLLAVPASKVSARKNAQVSLSSVAKYATTFSVRSSSLYITSLILSWFGSASREPSSLTAFEAALADLTS